MEKFKKKRMIYTTIIVAIGVFFGFIMLFTDERTLFFKIIFIVILDFIALTLMNMTISKQFKDQVITNIVNEDGRYFFSRKVPHSYDFKNLYLISRSARTFRMEDYLKGKCDELNYESFDLHATHQTGGKNNTTVTDFKGRFYRVELPFTFPGTIILKEETWKTVPSHLTHLDIESIEFNKLFNIYTSSVVDAYKIFTPKAIIDFISLAKNLSVSISFNITDNVMYIARYDKVSLFELKDIDDKDTIFEHIAIQESYINEIFTCINKEMWKKYEE